MQKAVNFILTLMLSASFTPTSKVSWKVEAFSLCMVFISSDSLRGPPWNEGHRPKVRHETSVLEVPASGTRRTQFSVLVLLMHLFHALYTRHTGIAHHRALQTSGRGWADSEAVHGMKCNGGTHALLEVPLSRDCCLMCTVLPVQEGVLTHTTEC